MKSMILSLLQWIWRHEPKILESGPLGTGSRESKYEWVGESWSCRWKPIFVANSNPCQMVPWEKKMLVEKKYRFFDFLGNFDKLFFQWKYSERKKVEIRDRKKNVEKKCWSKKKVSFFRFFRTFWQLFFFIWKYSGGKIQIESEIWCLSQSLRLDISNLS